MLVASWSKLTFDFSTKWFPFFFIQWFYWPVCVCKWPVRHCVSIAEIVIIIIIVALTTQWFSCLIFQQIVHYYYHHQRLKSMLIRLFCSLFAWQWHLHSRNGPGPVIMVRQWLRRMAHCQPTLMIVLPSFSLRSPHPPLTLTFPMTNWLIFWPFVKCQLERGDKLSPWITDTPTHLRVNKHRSMMTKSASSSFLSPSRSSCCTFWND